MLPVLDWFAERVLALLVLFTSAAKAFGILNKCVKRSVISYSFATIKGSSSFTNILTFPFSLVGPISLAVKHGM